MRTSVELDEEGVRWEVNNGVSCKGTVYEHRQTDRIQLPPDVENFSCPVCGSPTFEAIYTGLKDQYRSRGGEGVMGPGPDAGLPRTSINRIIGYSCGGCTVRFEDPVKFTSDP